MDRRDGTGPDDRRPEDYDPGSSAGWGNPGDKIGIRPDRGGVARCYGMGKGEAEMTQKEDTKTAHIVGQQLLGQVIQERDDWRAEATRLTNAGNGLIARLNHAGAELQIATEERDAARTDLKQAEENNHGLMTELQNMRAGLEVATEERDAANQAAEISYQKLQQALLECDTTRADVLRLSAERDAAEREKQLTWENLQRMIRKCDAVILERDATRDENYRLREERNSLHKENEGLRADALAYPPQRLNGQPYVILKADYDRQVIMIETLQEALKRTEASLKAAQMHDIDPRLKGFLANISQLADQSQDLLP